MHHLSDALKAEQQELNQNSEPIKKEENLLSILESTKIDPSKDIPPPPVCIYAIGATDGKEYILGNMGDFSLIKGKAKQRKTFAVSCIVASAIQNSLVIDQLKGNLPESQNNILYFDTEQSTYHVQKVLKRTLKLSETESIPDNISVFALRKYTPQQRRDLIEFALSHYKNIGLVVIDGIRDLVNSINSEEEATTISSDLLRWSEVLNCHIITVLHENKANEHARGHIGTELTGKCQTSIRVSTDEDGTTKIAAEFTRDEPFPDIFFTLDNDGIPKFSKEPLKKDKRSAKRTLEITSLENEDHWKLIKSVLKSNPKTDSDFVNTLVNVIQVNLREKIGITKAKQFKQYYSSEGWIISKGKSKGYEYTHPETIE